MHDGLDGERKAQLVSLLMFWSASDENMGRHAAKTWPRREPNCATGRSEAKEAARDDEA